MYGLIDRKPVLVAALALLSLRVGCGRTGLGPFTDDGVGDGAVDGGDEPDDGVSFIDPDEPEPDPDPPLDATCGNGIAEPGELCFLPQVTFWSRIDPCALDIADIDGDGHLDVITPNSDFEHSESSENLTSVLYGNGQGQLGEPVAYISGDDIPVGVRVGDLDGDGRPDLVVVNSDAGTVTVLLNDGDRQLVGAGRLAVGTSPVIADLGDVNGDGVLDLAVTASDHMSVALGRGDGSFDTPVPYSSPGMLWATRLLDINRDGIVDVVATNASENSLRTWIGEGGGSLFNAGGYEIPGAPLGFTNADVDGNGSVDLLVAHTFGMSVMLGDGEGGFVRVDEVTAGVDPRAVAVADFDNDGRLDAAIVNSSSQDVTLTIGGGNGDFEVAATYAVGILPSGIEAGDFNEDGVPDIVVSNQLSNSVGLILSNP